MENTGIECIGLERMNSDPEDLRMRRVNQQVALCRKNGGGYQQPERRARPRPLVARSPRVLMKGKLVPVLWKHLQLGYQFVRDLHGNQNIVIGHGVAGNVNQRFEYRQRAAGRGIPDAYTR